MEWNGIFDAETNLLDLLDLLDYLNTYLIRGVHSTDAKHLWAPQQAITSKEDNDSLLEAHASKPFPPSYPFIRLLIDPINHIHPDRYTPFFQSLTNQTWPVEAETK